MLLQDLDLGRTPTLAELTTKPTKKKKHPKVTPSYSRQRMFSFISMVRIHAHNDLSFAFMATCPFQLLKLCTY